MDKMVREAHHEEVTSKWTEEGNWMGGAVREAGRRAVWAEG